MPICVCCNEESSLWFYEKFSLCKRCYNYLIQQLPYRIKVFDLLGWECACCGNNHIFSLVADHIYADKKIKTGLKNDIQTAYFYRRILKDPQATEHYQTLCWPCNNSKKRNIKCKLNHSLRNRDDLLNWWKSFNFPPVDTRYKFTI